MSKIQVNSEIAGVIWKLLLQPGSSVTEEQSIMLIESMKMEIPILAPETGTILTMHVTEGKIVREGQLLATLITDNE